MVVFITESHDFLFFDYHNYKEAYISYSLISWPRPIDRNQDDYSDRHVYQTYTITSLLHLLHS